MDQTVVGNDGVGLMLPPDDQEIAFDHFADEIIEAGLRPPTQCTVRLTRVALELLNLSGAEVFRIDADQDLAGLAVTPLFFNTLTPPHDLAADVGKRFFGKLAHLSLIHI